MRVRNFIFSAALCLFLLGPAILVGAERGLHIEPPGWFTTELADNLSGDSGRTAVGPHLSLEGFASGQLQDALDGALSHAVPCRGHALLVNAALQRSAIKSSNALFGWSCYPTFYESPRVYIPSADALATMPDVDPGASEGRIRKFAEALDNFAASMPDKEFCLVLADAPDTTDANPSARLVSTHFSTFDALNILCANASQPNVHVVGRLYDNTSEYFRNYYRTDHHWNGFGALEAYRSVAAEMGLPAEFGVAAPPYTFDGLVIEGSLARRGLMFLDETACEPRFDLANLKVSGKGPAPAIQEDGEPLLLGMGQKAVYNFYSSWYGSYNLAQTSPVSNPEAPLQENALVIMDSYGNALHWLLAENYQHMRCYKDTKLNTNAGAKLRERIQKAEADVIYFIGNPYAYADLLDEHPDYLE